MVCSTFFSREETHHLYPNSSSPMVWKEVGKEKRSGQSFVLPGQKQHKGYYFKQVSKAGNEHSSDMYREESAAPVHNTWLLHQNTLLI